jgi:hypothetical protein
MNERRQGEKSQKLSEGIVARINGRRAETTIPALAAISALLRFSKS